MKSVTLCPQKLTGRSRIKYPPPPFHNVSERVNTQLRENLKTSQLLVKAVHHWVLPMNWWHHWVPPPLLTSGQAAAAELLRIHRQPEELCPAQQCLRLFDEVTYAFQVVVTLSAGDTPVFFGKWKQIFCAGWLRRAGSEPPPRVLRLADSAKMARVSRAASCYCC